MAQLIYRGITHTGTQAPKARMAQDLIYRGVAHDGLADASPDVTRMASMCYRGVKFALVNSASQGDDQEIAADGETHNAGVMAA